MNEAFNNWWDGDIDTTDNPYRQDSAAYWAWAGWMAGVKAEREACAKVCDEAGGRDSDTHAWDAAAAIRARSKQ
jgi:hypothetical protein